MTSGPLIAVVGMDCLLPGAASAEEWIARSLRGERCLREVPQGRWPLDPTEAKARGLGVDGAATLVGGFVDDEGSVFDWVARVTAGAIDGVAANRSRTSLLLANLSLPSTGAVRVAGQAYRPWLDAMGADASWLDGADARERYQSGGPALDAAEALGLGGTALALDAACASSLYAVRLACERLAAGLDDCVLAAAVQRADSAFLFMGFTQLRALSGQGIPRPLDARADGLIIGEGAACVALKRLADAERDGDTIHAVLDGGGLGNDGRSGNMLAPSASGQLRTLQQAWAGRDLDELGYVECHATGTSLGDGVELTALRELIGDREVVLSSAKALIGHTITVAGLAGLIRAVGAVRDGILPPQPDIQPRDEAHGFTILDEARAWSADERVAAVSAFGFGGTNAHIIVRSRGTSEARGPRVLPELAVTAARARLGVEAGSSVSRGLRALPGAFLAELSVEPGRFRLPPRELADLVPQQLLALDLASRAAADDGAVDGARTGAVLGMGIDGNVADHVLRWLAGEHGDWVSPPLTSSRVQGLLPNFVANRLAAQLGLEGPSWSVSAEALSGLVAVEQAALLLGTGTVDAVLAGAVDLPGHPGLGAVSASQRGALAEGGAVFVLRRADEVPEDERIATLVLCDPGEVAPRGRGHAESAEGALALFDALGAGGVVTVADRGRRCGVRVRPGPRSPRTDEPAPARALPRVVTAHSGPVLPWPAWQGGWGGDTVPRPLPRRDGPPGLARFDGAVPDETAVPLVWPEVTQSTRAPVYPAPMARTPQPSPPAREAAVVEQPVPAVLAREAAHLSELARALHRSTTAATAAHADWLRAHTAAGERVAAAALSLVGGGGGGGATLPAAVALDLPERTIPSQPPAPPAVAHGVASASEPPLFDLDVLRAFAEGSISSCLGPEYADLDAYEPRVRLPMDPLLLVSRVVEMEGERGELKASRLVTEYDLPTDAVWVDRGKPPVSVVIESGQADLFLVSVLGVDAHCKGERLYRLLDCDLTFHGPRPVVGETLRHDIRIKRFARLGGKILFYFEYDCTSRTDGRAVLTMREGVAGFFTPDELAVPQGVDPAPPDHTAAPLAAAIEGAPSSLGDEALTALREGRFADALGPSFGVCDGAALRPPSGPWGLLHRAPVLETSGGPHGLGRVVAEQDLRDDDWFNACHFKGDPCMPGTLMFDGCTQALELWLLASGHAAAWPDATFEPVAGQTARLRCRGQVVPGQHKLVYDARITGAGLDPTPWVVADVILHVDGTPVVRAEGVSLCLHGERKGVAVPPSEPLRAVRAAALPSENDFLEFAVGRPSVAFGEAFATYDSGEQRCPRIPGPPLALIHEVTDLRAARGVLAGGTGVTMRTRVPSDAPYLLAQPGCSLPVVALMEIALQPCGWLTAWEGAALGKGDLYFRNLGGTARLSGLAWPDVGSLGVRATLTRVSESAGMILTFFDFSVRAEDGTLICEGDTHFGYFSRAALAAQKGLGLDTALSARLARETEQAAIEPVVLAHIREDWRMLDRVTAADPKGGEAGLGFYAAEVDVDPAAWFFVAHFHQDPVMPGSLGVEGLAQLAAYALGSESVAYLDAGVLDWKYRGQVTRDRQRLLLQLEVTERYPDRLVARGWLTADGTPIYAVEGLSVQVASPPGRPTLDVLRPQPVSALIDTWQMRGEEGTGTLRLDPAVHPWLADHCPTLVIPAVPMAFAVEVAAEAALLLRPGKVVVGAPRVSADRWIAPTEPVDLLIAAVADGDTVMVSLALHHENPRFPALSGPKVHMAVVVQLADAYPEPPPAPEPLDAPDVALSAADYYLQGHTFHGPSLHGMVDLGKRDGSEAESRFRPSRDADLLGEGVPDFVLDPLLLDVATHPMMSSAPETWGADGPGTLAYPIAAEDMRFFGPRPTSEVTCRLVCVQADRQLVFDVTLSEGDRVWASFRWREAVVDGGLLGADSATIRDFCVDRQALPVTLGRPDGAGWRVSPADVAEPLDGSLVRLLGRPEEVCAVESAEDRRAWLQHWIAVKEAVRAHLRSVRGVEIHPASVRVVRLADGWVVVEAVGLSSQDHLDLLGPTTAMWTVRPEGADVVAERVER